jgi:hypothetical protein
MFVLNIYIFIHHFFMIKFVKYIKQNFPGYGTVLYCIVLLNAVLLRFRVGSGMIFTGSKFC